MQGTISGALLSGIILAGCITVTAVAAEAETYHLAWKNSTQAVIGCNQLKIEMLNSNGGAVNQDTRNGSLAPGAVLQVPTLTATNCTSITLRAVCSFGYDSKTFTQQGLACKSGTISITAAGLAF